MKKTDQDDLYQENPKRSDWELLKRFFHFLKPYKAPLRNVYILYFLNSFLNLVPAASLWYLFDLVIAPKETRIFGMVLDTRDYMSDPAIKARWVMIYFFSMLALIILANSIGVIMWRLGTKVTQKTLFDIKVHIMHHLHKLSISFFEKERTGSIMTRAVGDVEQMQSMLQNSYSMIYSLIHIVFAPFMMIIMSPLLFLFSLIPLPIILWALRRMKKKLRPLYRHQREKLSEVNSAVQEQIQGIREIKAFGQEDIAREDVSRANMRYLDAINDAMKIFSVNHQTLYGSGQLSLLLIGAVGGLLIIWCSDSFSIGMIIAFIPLVSAFLNPFINITNQYDIIQRGLASMDRVFSFLDLQPDIVNSHNAVWKDLDKGSVVFENVTFHYDENKAGLHNINLEIEAGKTLALVGTTGSGKSTLVSLIPRFYDPVEGRILIDGYDIRKLKMEALRKSIGIVFQDTFLFYGTIAENIAFSRREASWEEIKDAAKLANIHDFIESLAEGYNTRIGERGVKLSGGQRQRIAIARMILKNPSIIILDEATSSLDNTTEVQLQESLDNLMRDRTAIVIAHRLSTIRNVDKVVVLENGRILESGTHEELLKKGGKYADLVNSALTLA